MKNLSNERADKNQKLKNTKRERDTAKRELDATRKELNTAKNNVDQLQQSINALMEAGQGNLEMNEGLKRLVAELKTERDEAQAKALKEEGQHKFYKDQYAAQTAEIADVKARLADVARTTSEKLEENDRLSVYRIRWAEQQKELAEKKSATEAAEEMVTELEAQLTKLHKRHDDAKKELEDKKTECTSAKEAMESLKMQIQAIQLEKDAAVHKYNQNKNSANELSESVRVLEQLRRDIAELRQKLRDGETAQEEEKDKTKIKERLIHHIHKRIIAMEEMTNRECFLMKDLRKLIKEVTVMCESRAINYPDEISPLEESEDSNEEAESSKSDTVAVTSRHDDDATHEKTKPHTNQPSNTTEQNETNVSSNDEGTDKYVSDIEDDTVDQSHTHPTEHNESKGESAQDPYGLKLNSEDEWPINEMSLQTQNTMSERDTNEGKNQAHSSSIPTNKRKLKDRVEESKKSVSEERTINSNSSSNDESEKNSKKIHSNKSKRYQ